MMTSTKDDRAPVPRALLREAASELGVPDVRYYENIGAATARPTPEWRMWLRSTGSYFARSAGNAPAAAIPCRAGTKVNSLAPRGRRRRGLTL